MSYLDQERSRRMLLVSASMALTSLAAAGTQVIKMREHCPPEAQDLVAAIREDISRMMSNVEALREVALGEG